MVNYGSAKPSPRKSVVYDTFLSVDFAKAPANVAKYHSPNSLNMMRDEYGKVRRRMGYFEKFNLTNQIYGIAKFGSDYIVHAGTKLYKCTFGTAWTNTEIYTDMNEHISQYFSFNDKLYIIDGKTLLTYDGTTCAAVEGKIPRVIIAGTPTGGGTQFEQVNLIQDKWEQSFKVTAGNPCSVTSYQLAFGGLDSTLVVMKIGRTDGTWLTLTESAEAFTVDRTTGVVTMTDAYATYDLGAEDNVIFIASKDRTEQRQRIFGCTIGKPFGINGYENQLFISGNPTHPNKMFWSAINDLTYWGDLQYAVLGQDSSAIMSFNILNASLVAHKDSASGKSYLCSVFSTLINALETPQLKVEKVIGGSGVMCKYATADLGEPLFISPLGVQALTYKDVTGNEIETLRGDRINHRLLAEANIENAVACVYKYFYLIAINGNVYVLDRLNPRMEGNALDNAFQYNAFFWNHVPATSFFVDGDKLLFGTADGSVMEFYTDESETTSYNDNGVTYDWSWEFPEYVGDLFYKNKSIKYVAIRAKSYTKTSVILDIRLEGFWDGALQELWYEAVNDNSSFGYLDLSDLDLDNLSLSTDTTPKMTGEKYNERRLDKFAFRVRGNTINEPFGLYSFAFEVKENGKHKGV